VIYDISHITTYAHLTPVASMRCTMHLLPRNDCGQSVIASSVDIMPAPRVMRERLDFFGNRVIEAHVARPHRDLDITLRARVRVARPPAPAAALTPAWEATRKAALSVASLASRAPAHWIFPSRFAPLCEPVTDYARTSFPAGRTVLEGALDLTRRMHADFTYDPEATHVRTPLSEAFEKRGGVCQDFAHIMIAGLRGLGLPAGYVSGYLRTIPAPGQPHLEGADASHAWTSVWCGAEFGWIDLDPTNALLVENEHIVTAVGRDYADVAPVSGVVLGGGRQDLDVRVDVTPVTGEV
jgi:transglutaminase-like putative cysteine protease